MKFHLYEHSDISQCFSGDSAGIQTLNFRFRVSWTVAGEFAEGFADIHHPACKALLGGFEILPMTEATAGHYARVTSILRRDKQLIGTNDLWIAAAALAHEMPLVTNNTHHFGRVPGLTLRGY